MGRQAADHISLPVDGTRRLLTYDGGETDFRMLEVSSAKGLPFDVTVNFQAGQASQGLAMLTVSRAARVCLLCAGAQVDVINRANEVNEVHGVMTTAFAETRNVFEVRGACDGVAPVQITIPPFATQVHLHIADRTLLGNTTVKIFDGANNVRAEFSGNLLPPMGIPLGSARLIEILTDAPTNVRAVFNLAL